MFLRQVCLLTYTRLCTPAQCSALRKSKLALSPVAIRHVSSNRLYTKKHEWISVEDRAGQHIGRVGISNHAQEALGDVVYVQAPELGSKYCQFDEVGAIESVKAASEVLAPVSGEIVAVNRKLEEKPSLVNGDCYGEGWLYELKVEKSEELEQLMDEHKYEQFLKSEDQS